MHGLSERQVGLGLSGRLIVEGLAGRIPGLANVRERQFVLKTVELADSDDPTIADEWHGTIATIDGRIAIEETLRPGETVLWHVGNQSANLPWHLALSGHLFTVLARDGNPLPAPVEVDELDLGPASRMDVLVTGGAPGTYELIARNVLTGQGPSLARDRRIGHVAVAGSAAMAARPSMPKPEDRSALTVTGTRNFVFTQSRDGEKFFMNDRLFDAERIDTKANLGDVEDWTIRNDSDELHVFHIHQLPFQVMAQNGEALPFAGLLDTVRVPERGSVTIRLSFANPVIAGRFMYHCHVLKHEDKGMMQNIEVVDPKAPPTSTHHGVH
jgi:suppressor of ftsI